MPSGTTEAKEFAEKDQFQFIADQNWQNWSDSKEKSMEAMTFKPNLKLLIPVEQWSLNSKTYDIDSIDDDEADC